MYTLDIPWYPDMKYSTCKQSSLQIAWSKPMAVDVQHLGHHRTMQKYHTWLQVGTMQHRRAGLQLLQQPLKRGPFVRTLPEKNAKYNLWQADCGRTYACGR